MNQPTSLLDRLYVAKPCTADWEAMAGDERVRFCNLCKLNVYNLSAMSRQEAETLIAQTEGRLCTKFYRRADGTILTQDCPVGWRALQRRVSRTASAVFSTLLSLFAPTLAVYADDPAKTCPHLKIKTVQTETQSEQGAITGTVYDINRAVIVQAQVTLVDEDSGKQLTTRSNREGQFGLSSLSPGSYTITIYSIGFVTFKKTRMKVAAKEELRMDVTLHVGSSGGAALLPEKPTSKGFKFGE